MLTEPHLWRDLRAQVLKIHEGRPHIGDIVAQGEVHIMIITPNNEDPRDKTDGLDLRRLSLARKTPLVTTIVSQPNIHERTAT
jgi:hypothetical protein